MDAINSLPDLMLVEIFGNLSPNMIKSCSLVCKRWNEIIGNSLELMQRFQLDLGSKQITRKYQAFIIRNFTSDTLDVISRHRLQSLTICPQSNPKLSTVIKALNKLPTLKVLKMYLHCIDDISGNSNFEKAQINVEILYCHDTIIHIFDCNTIKKLKLLHSTDQNINMLAVEFLKRQEKLEHLKLSGELRNLFTMPEIFELKFSLKRFKYKDYVPFPHYEAFIRFLYQHKKTLESLKLDFCTEPKFGIEFIHKYALENLLSLNHLKLGYFKGDDVGEELGDELSFDELPSATYVTKNMESLAFRARSTDMNENRRFFAMFPNLKRLKFEGTTDMCKDMELLQCISEINVNVEILELDQSDEHWDNIYFPKLKILKVGHFNDEATLSAFISRHSKTLEEIDIFSCDQKVTQLTINEIFKCENVKHLVLYLYYEPNFKVIEKINDISSRIEKFTLKVHHSFNRTDKYYFPDDKAIWEKEVETWEKKIREALCFVQ